MFNYLVRTPYGCAINKDCLTIHVKGVKDDPIDGQALSDDWIAKNIGKLGGVAPVPIVPN